MTQYIDKAAIVAEFNRLISELIKEGEDTMFEQGRISAFEDAKLFLDTLEAKEVDLEKEMSEYFVEHSDEFFSDKYKLFAKHFFELGLETQKD